VSVCLDVINRFPHSGRSMTLKIGIGLIRDGRTSARKADGSDEVDGSREAGRYRLSGKVSESCREGLGKMTQQINASVLRALAALWQIALPPPRIVA